MAAVYSKYLNSINKMQAFDHHLIGFVNLTCNYSVGIGFLIVYMYCPK
jgi:hypothetical protein